MKLISKQVAILLVLSIWVGCGRSEKPNGNVDRSPSVGMAASSELGTLKPLEIRVGDETDLAKLLEESRGKVVLVDFWATWCPPCMELLPHTLEMARKYADRGLAVVLVAINDPKEQAEDVKAVLEKNGAAGVVNLLCRYGIGSEAVEKFAIDDGSLPHLRLYDREGRLHAKFGATAIAPNPARIEAEVEHLLELPQESAAPDPNKGPELIISGGQSASAS